jgi:hypothetical protein
VRPGAPESKNGAAFSTSPPLELMPCWGEMLEELDPLLPGSEQFKLQQSRAIETPGVLLPDCAFLQQSGMLAIEPSPPCALTPIAPPIMAATRRRAVSQLRIVQVTILSVQTRRQGQDQRHAFFTRC